MTLWDKNIAVLRRTSPGVAEALTWDEDPEFVVEASTAGPPTARVSGVYLHSKRDPIREATRVVESRVPEASTTVVLLGFGLGYHVQAVLRSRRDATVVVIDPGVDAFSQALKIRDLEETLADPRLILVLGAPPETIPTVLRRYETGELAMLAPKGLRATASPQAWEAIENAVVSFKQRREINRNTLIRFGRLWVRNLARNLGRFVDSRAVGDLTGCLRGVPTLILGAGPSLDRVLPHLPELAERMAIIAVDTALGPCMAQGVEPDFLVVVDPQYWNTRHLDRSTPSRTILISESSTHPRVFELLGRLPTYFCSSLFPLGEYLESAIGARGKLGAGGSVSTTAWDFARVIGSSEIVTAGVDLGFPNHQTHCSGSFFEERTNLLSSRTCPAETMAFLYLYDADPYEVEANDGSSVLTDKRMVIYRWWFENQLQIHTNVTAMTTALGGVKIPGIPLVSINDLEDLPQVRGDIEARLAPFRQPDRHPRAHRAAVVEALDRLLKQLADLKRLAGRAVRITDSVVDEGRSEARLRSALAELDDIDRRIYSVGNRRIPSFLMQDVISDLTSRSDGDPLGNSRKLYDALHSSAEYHRRYLSIHRVLIAGDR